jgi:uncharacterized membrane protein YhaH (DUF805 family)
MEEPTLSVLRALFSFKGRLCRQDYWIKGQLPLFLPAFLILGTVFDNTSILPSRALNDALLMALLLLVLWPYVALNVKRLHDRDRSGWLLLLILVPIAGAIWLMIEILRSGTDGTNRYGPDPDDPAAVTV